MIQNITQTKSEGIRLRYKPVKHCYKSFYLGKQSKLESSQERNVIEANAPDGAQ